MFYTRGLILASGTAEERVMTPPSDTTNASIEIEADFEELAEKQPLLQRAFNLARKQPLSATGLVIIIARITTFNTCSNHPAICFFWGPTNLAEIY